MFSVHELPDRVEFHPCGPSRGAVLVPFHTVGVAAGDEDPLMHAHRFFWEVRELARVIAGLGFHVDVINLGAAPPPRFPDYQAILGISDALWRYAPGLPGARKLMWMSGSHPEFQNRREMERIQALQQRRGGAYRPRRQIANVQGELASIEMADHCALIGNATTLSTYQPAWRAKIELIDVGDRPPCVKPQHMLPPSPREFVWSALSGSILKGLDIVLDLFAQHDWPTLHIVGSIEQEEDFMSAYRLELDGHPRIRRHGSRFANDPELAAIFNRAAVVIHPSASEGMAASVTNCLQVGLYPVISRESGIDLPEGCGRILQTCSHAEVADAVEGVLKMSDAQLALETGRIQAMALERFSRSAFTRRVRSLFETWLGA